MARIRKTSGGDSARRSRPSVGRGGSRSVTLISRSALCSLGGISERQLTLWEHEELIVPSRFDKMDGSEPLYDSLALKRLRLIRTLSEQLEVNLPGISVILNLLDQMPRRR